MLPQFEPPPRERFYDDGAHPRPPPSARATGHATSREGLGARRSAVLHRIQAEADAAVAELEERQRVSRIQRHQSRMNSRPAAFDANYVEREEAEEKEEDIEELCDILLEEYGMEVEPLPAGARAPIYGPRVRPAWPVTEERVGHERERRNRMSRESRHELESSENEASEEEDEELVKSMSRGPADRLRAQTSLRGTYHGYERPFGGDWRRHNPYDDDSYEAPSRSRPKPRGPGPAPPAGAEAVFPTGEDRTRERERDMREREMRGERETRGKRELKREELEREIARLRKAQKEEEWEDTHPRRRTFVTARQVVGPKHPPHPPPDHPYEHAHGPHSEYDLRRTESYSGPSAAVRSAYEAGYGSGVETRRRRRSEYPGPASRPRSRSPPGGQDMYMHGGRHADDAPAPAPREGGSEDEGRGGGKYQVFR